ncbi:MAG: HAD family hydrolase [Candidatus Promineifilaceae bacterium]|jgi:phosphoglycolate phosphatase
MAIICAGNQQFDVNCAVFDKDGTLIDFEPAWGQRIRDWIACIVEMADGNESLSKALFHTIGYEPVKREVAIDGPILAASGNTMQILAATVLYQELGLPWHEAENIALDSLKAIFSTPLTDKEIRPLGDVKGTVTRLREAGIMVVVATADNRAIAEHCLNVLDIRQEVSLLICGDDPLPQKPKREVLGHIAQELETAPERILMVGDTINDMLTGRNGNAAGCIAISPNNTNGAEVLAPFADTILTTIADLQVQCKE